MDDCPKCGGAGFVLKAANEGDGQAVYSVGGPAVLTACPVCNGTDRRQEYLRNVSGLTDEEYDRDFAGYWSQKHAGKTLRDGRLVGVTGFEILDMARNVLTENGWLTLAGSNGNGKSYLLTAIVNEAVRAGRLAVYIRMADLLEHLRQAFKPGAEVDYDQLWALICRAEVLAIDEAEKYNATTWAEEKVMSLAEDRNRRWRECVTLWSVNDVADVPSYLKSRMTCGRFSFVVMTGNDIRPGLRR